MTITELEEKRLEFTESRYNKLVKKLNNFEKMPKQEIIRTMLILSIWKPDQTILVARKKSVFRFWGKQNQFVLDIIDALLSFKNIINFSEETINYLENKANSVDVSTYCEQLEKKLKKV